MFEKVYNILITHLQIIYKRKIASIFSIIFIFLSTICLLITLIGSISGNVYLNKFTFNEPINAILQRDTIKFTLLGYCIDDNCTYVSNSFSKDNVQMSMSKISSINDNKAIDKYNVIDSVKQKAKEIANDTSKNVDDTIKDFGLDALKILLTSFENLIPNVPIKDKSGIARPIIAAVVFNFISLILLFTMNYNNKKLFFISTSVLLLLSFLLNLCFLLISYSIFCLVFNVIENIPSIGVNKTGYAIYLSALSTILLFFAIFSTFINKMI